jgi:hypothetical protein
LAHELSHIELHARLGVITSYLYLPSWFDEGVAVVVSKDPRPKYSASAYQRLSAEQKTFPITSLTTGDEWIKAMREGIPNYLLAAHEIREWFRASSNSQARLLQFITEFTAGKSFSDAYSALPSSSAR